MSSGSGEGKPGGGAPAARHEQVCAGLRSRFTALAPHIEPMVRFVSLVGQPGAPFLGDLLLFHSEHVDATRQRSDPEFWDALSKLPPGLGWPVVAFAKDNWSSDKVRGGICKGVHAASLSSFALAAGYEKLLSLDQHLRAWRGSHAEALEKLTEKVRARILGRFDVLSSRVFLKGMTECPHPLKAEVSLELKSLADCATVATHDLAMAGRTASEKLETNPKLDALERKAAGRPTTAPSGKDIAPAFDALGRQINRLEALAARGCVVGTKVTVVKEVSVSRNGKTVRIAKGDSGPIASVTESQIGVHFGRFGMHMWSLDEFPVRFLSFKEESEQPSVVAQDTSTWRLCRTQAWGATRAQAMAIMALDAVRGAMPKLKKSFVLCGDGSPDPVKVVSWRGKKTLELTTDISAEKPLLIFPFTTNVKFQKQTEAPLAATNLKASDSAEEVVCYSSCFVDPLEHQGADQSQGRQEGKTKEAVVEPFWLVSKGGEEGNMERVIVEVVPGYGVRFEGTSQVTATGGTVQVPCLRSMGNLGKGTTLCVRQGDCKAKKPRLD